MKQQRNFVVSVNPGRCKGCGLCVMVCPQKILKLAPVLNRRGVHPSSCVDTESCIGCLSCADICPDAAIDIVKKAEKQAC